MDGTYASAVLTNKDNLKSLSVFHSAALVQSCKIGNMNAFRTYNQNSPKSNNNNNIKKKYYKNKKEKSKATCHRCDKTGHFAKECSVK
jgi:Zinc knuckle